MTSYTHHQGKIFEDGKEITDFKARSLLQSHKLGAERSRQMNWPKTAEVSERFVRELDQALGAAEIYARVAKQARGMRPSPEDIEVSIAGMELEHP